MTYTPLTDDFRDLEQIIARLEGVLQRIDVLEEECSRSISDLREECNCILSDAKVTFHHALEEAEQCGYEPVPSISIEDRKLKTAWIALFKYHDGATADMLADDLHRHRTTISTYLNTLVLMGCATKHRLGHEIYYRAVLNKEEGETK